LSWIWMFLVVWVSYKTIRKYSFVVINYKKVVLFSNMKITSKITGAQASPPSSTPLMQALYRNSAHPQLALGCQAIWFYHLLPPLNCLHQYSFSFMWTIEITRANIVKDNIYLTTRHPYSVSCLLPLLCFSGLTMGEETGGGDSCGFSRCSC